MNKKGNGTAGKVLFSKTKSESSLTFTFLEGFCHPRNFLRTSKKKHPQMPEVQIDNHFKRGTTDHLIRSHNCSVTNTESFAIAPQRIRSHLLLLRSEYGDYFDTESSNCANSPLCSGGLCSDEARQWLASDSQLELKSTLDMLASLDASELLWLTWVL